RRVTLFLPPFVRGLDPRRYADVVRLVAALDVGTEKFVGVETGHLEGRQQHREHLLDPLQVGGAEGIRDEQPIKRFGRRVGHGRTGIDAEEVGGETEDAGYFLDREVAGLDELRIDRFDLERLELDRPRRDTNPLAALVRTFPDIPNLLGFLAGERLLGVQQTRGGGVVGEARKSVVQGSREVWSAR